MEEEQAPSGGFTLHAWVDESMQMPGPERDGLYLLAAAVASPATCDPMRENLRELLLKGSQRLHWRDESAPRRAKIASAIAEHDLLHAKHAMPAELHIDFAFPTEEPMLWVADAVAGAVGQARRGIGLDVRGSLGQGIDEINIEL